MVLPAEVKYVTLGSILRYHLPRIDQLFGALRQLFRLKFEKVVALWLMFFIHMPRKSAESTAGSDSRR